MPAQSCRLWDVPLENLEGLPEITMTCVTVSNRAKNVWLWLWSQWTTIVING